MELSLYRVSNLFLPGCYLLNWLEQVVAEGKVRGMLNIEVPGFKQLELEVLVLDYNGTIAFDGELKPGVQEMVCSLAEYLEIHVLTSDTFGTVVERCQELPVIVTVLETDDHTAEKADYLTQFDARQVVAVGNGSNDWQMLEKAALGIVVIGDEGCSGKALRVADAVVSDFEGALGLLLQPQRLRATLRC